MTNEIDQSGDDRLGIFWERKEYQKSSSILFTVILTRLRRGRIHHDMDEFMDPSSPTGGLKMRRYWRVEDNFWKTIILTIKKDRVRKTNEECLRVIPLTYDNK